MKKLWESLDKKYVKICGYASASVIITIIILGLLYSSGGFWVRLWTIFTAVLKPVVIGGIISYLLSPIVDKFEGLFNKNKNYKWARYVAILLSFLLIIAFIALVVVIIVLTIYKNISAVNLETVLGLGDLIEQDTQNLYQSVKDLLASAGLSINQFSDVIIKAAISVKDIITGLFFGIIFSIYFMLDGRRIKDYWKRAFAIITGKKNEERAEQFWHNADRIFSGYLRGQFIDAAIVCVLTGIVFTIVGVPEALLIALLVGIGNMIPYVGPIVGYCAVVIVCLPTASYHELIAGLVALFVIMLIDGNIINPRLLSSNIKIHPLLVVAALIGGGALGGFVGMLVAVPVAALIKLYFDRFLDKKENDN